MAIRNFNLINERKIKMKSVKFETTQLKDGEGLVAFFRSIGWDGECDLNPMKIFVCKKDWEEMCNSFGTLGEKFSFMNYGPSASDDVPSGHAVIHEGAFKEEASVDGNC